MFSHLYISCCVMMFGWHGVRAHTKQHRCALICEALVPPPPRSLCKFARHLALVSGSYRTVTAPGHSDDF